MSASRAIYFQHCGVTYVVNIWEILTFKNAFLLEVVHVDLPNKKMLHQRSKDTNGSLHNLLSLLPLHPKVQTHLVPTRQVFEYRQKDEEDILGHGG